MIFQIQIEDGHRGKLKVKTNCYWVQVFDENDNIVFERTPQKGPWLDEFHRNITTVLNMIEKYFSERKN